MLENKIRALVNPRTPLRTPLLIHTHAHEGVINCCIVVSDLLAALFKLLEKDARTDTF